MINRYGGAAAYFAGALSARTADEMSAPALLLLGMTVLGPDRPASLLFAALTAASAVGGPLLGALMDRSPHPGRLLALALAAYAAGLALVTAVLGHLAVAIAVALVTGLLAPSLSGAWTPRLADVLPERHLGRGHSLDAATYNVASLAGPAAAGLIAGIDAYWAMAVTIGLLLLAVPAALALPRQEPRPSAKLTSDLKAGFAAIVRAPGLRRITAASMIAFAGIGMLVVSCPPLGEQRLGGAGHGGLLLSLLAAGAMATTAVTARWPPRGRPETVFAVAGTGVAAGLCLLTAAPNAAVLLAAAVLTGAGEGPQLAAVFDIRHRDAPPRLRGQVFTTGASLKITAGAVGAALGGALPLALALVLAATAQLLAAALLLSSGRGRARRRETPRCPPAPRRSSPDSCPG
ncbi:MFS transporter [Actinomadura logoneensis]|uniref:MFS transporter n=1 Tax=Actinomadura logoneensis TaxID=2293572 RepID=A0A372JFN5_9ACTN|nr:MFS transporter [Actinomadura logoneensis]RFU38178.1 MFS transporter [Actinomadura logoneensis]